MDAECRERGKGDVSNELWGESSLVGLDSRAPKPVGGPIKNISISVPEGFDWMDGGRTLWVNGPGIVEGVEYLLRQEEKKTI